MNERIENINKEKENMKRTKRILELKNTTTKLKKKKKQKQKTTESKTNQINQEEESMNYKIWHVKLLNIICSDIDGPRDYHTQ